LNGSLKLLFDECIGEPVMKHLASLVATGPVQAEFLHVRRLLLEGIPDSEWVPKIAANGWIVISADRGKRNRRERRDEKLPYLCRLHSITDVLLSASVHQYSNFDKGRAILAVWDEIAALPAQPAGSRWSLRKAGTTGHKLVHCPIS
jgi:hypothetical protein